MRQLGGMASMHVRHVIAGSSPAPTANLFTIQTKEQKCQTN